MKVKYEMKRILYGISSGGSLAIVARRRLRHPELLRSGL
jgi:hypothetical protein